MKDDGISITSEALKAEYERGREDMRSEALQVVAAFISGLEFAAKISARQTHTRRNPSLWETIKPW